MADLSCGKAGMRNSSQEPSGERERRGKTQLKK